MKETKEEFEAGYLIRSGMTTEKLKKAGLKAVECACLEKDCRGWRMAYADLYAFMARLQGLPLVT